MKKYLIFLFVIASLTACRSDRKKIDITINGRVEGAKAGELIYEIYTYRREPPYYQLLKDTINFTDGKFLIEDNIVGDMGRSISLPSKSQDSFFFFPDSGEQQIELKIDVIHKSVVFGSKNDKLFRQFNNSLAKLEISVRNRRDVALKRLQAEPENQGLNRELIKIEKSLSTGMVKLLSDCIEKNPASPVGAFLIYKKIGDFKDLSDLYHLLGKPAQSCAYGRIIKGKIDRLARLQPGKEAPDFSLKAPDNRVVSLKDYRGKYVLIDFWAHGCIPCREENQNLKKIYEKYRKSDFEIIGVSIDGGRFREKWLKAIKDDDLPWVQVSDDPEGLVSGKTANRYAVHGIPHQVLIDETGKIVLTSVGSGGTRVKDKLKEVFNR